MCVRTERSKGSAEFNAQLVAWVADARGFSLPFRQALLSFPWKSVRRVLLVYSFFRYESAAPATESVSQLAKVLRLPQNLYLKLRKCRACDAKRRCYTARRPIPMIPDPDVT